MLGVGPPAAAVKLQMKLVHNFGKDSGKDKVFEDQMAEMAAYGSDTVPLTVYI